MIAQSVRSITALLIAALFFGVLPVANAQQWARDMFEISDHDFGIVPRGADTQFVFEFTNKYEQAVHVASVRSSCGCTTPSIVTTEDIKTYQKGGIACKFNTRSFIGSKNAQITVVFDKPTYAEVQLNVKGNIRSDIVTEPGIVEFGEVDRGTEATQQVTISYAGKAFWEIKDVRSDNTNLGVSFPKPAVRSRDGRVEYYLSIRLKPDAPVGELNDQIVLVTNDQQYNFVALPVRGQVLPPLVVKPPQKPIGTLKVGEEWSERIVLSAKEAFSVSEVTCADPRFEFDFPQPSPEKRLHFVQVRFKATGKPGAFSEPVTFVTSLAKEGTVKLSLSGNIVE